MASEGVSILTAFSEVNALLVEAQQTYFPERGPTTRSRAKPPPGSTPQK
jgi:hypothetical protein